MLLTAQSDDTVVNVNDTARHTIRGGREGYILVILGYLSALGSPSILVLELPQLLGLLCARQRQ